MDNDLLWTWQSFGYNTTVAKATEAVNIMHSEAEATRRVCILELFGAESGFVAANAALASGHVDLALVPEPFANLNADQCERALNMYVTHLVKRVATLPLDQGAHGIIVMAEGVGQHLQDKEVKFQGTQVTAGRFAEQLKAHLKATLKDANHRPIETYVNQPRHNIRAVPANAHDQVYCERLGALAVDNALAGYTDFMISQYLTEYVLVPLEMVTMGQKSIPADGMFWRQVISSTGQPNIAVLGGGLAKWEESGSTTESEDIDRKKGAVADSAD